ncbi:MAG: PDZ domain-containing protein [Phycisphaerae bacterium]
MKNTWVILLLIFCISGCCSLDKKTEKSLWDSDNYRNYGEMGERRKQKLLKDFQPEGNILVGSCEVIYAKGLKLQAERIAHRFDKDINYIRQSTYIQIPFDCIRLYIVRQKEMYDLLRTPFFIEKDNKFGSILYVQPGQEKFEEILASNFSNYLATFHEIVETSLMNPREGSGLLNDYSWTAYGCIPCRRYYYTRWFREGLAEYASCLISESILSEIPSKTNSSSLIFNIKENYDFPFSALSKVRGDLFSWDQFLYGPPTINVVRSIEQCSSNPNSPKEYGGYYRAALGLFLTIHDRYSDEGIKLIVMGIRNLEQADGPSLIRLINQTLKTDIVKLAADFRFPYAGMGMIYIQPNLNDDSHTLDREGLHVDFLDPKGLGAKAGIQVGDYIIQINGHNILTNFDYERTLNKYKDQKSVKVKVYRKGKGELSLEMKLSN